MKTHFTPDQFGELIVTAKNKVEIPLQHHQPTEIFVKFKDEHEHAPCNPHHFDELEYSLHYKHSHYMLIIKWEVSSVREIFWAVKY